MRFSISSNVVVALTLWLMLILSYVSESHGYDSGNEYNTFGHGRNSHGTPKKRGGKNHGGKNHGGKNHRGKYPPSNPSSPPPSPSGPIVSPPSPPSRPIGLKVGFYKGLCPNNVDIEAKIIKKVQERFAGDPTIGAALARMQFHDCFVHGCDASILIDGDSSEKNAGANLSVREYELIDALKRIAEAECPDMVSCADIIAIATKEVIKLGGGPDIAVKTGRNDGLVSNVADVNLPSPFEPLAKSIEAFRLKGFTVREMVVLLGCHTIGKVHCQFIQDRLDQVPSDMDPTLRRQLMPVCPQGTNANNFTSLDQTPQSSNTFDNSFYQQVLKRRAVLAVDAALGVDAATRDFVSQLAQSPSLFNSELASAMTKLQELDVHLGNKGEIRKVCNKIN